MKKSCDMLCNSNYVEYTEWPALYIEGYLAVYAR